MGKAGNFIGCRGVGTLSYDAKRQSAVPSRQPLVGDVKQLAAALAAPPKPSQREVGFGRTQTAPREPENATRGWVGPLRFPERVAAVVRARDLAGRRNSVLQRV
jgi:hypothetical protein